MVSKISTPPGVKMYRWYGKRVYKWACSRTSATTAERVKTRAQNMQMYVRITARKLGSKSAIVPTVYDVWLAPKTGKATTEDFERLLMKAVTGS